MQVFYLWRHHQYVFSRKINPPVTTDDGCEVDLFVLQTLFSPNICSAEAAPRPAGLALAQTRKIVLCQVRREESTLDTDI